MASLEEMEKESKARQDKTTYSNQSGMGCGSCTKPDVIPLGLGRHMTLVDRGNGLEYMMITEDGRFIPVEDEWSREFGY